MQNNNYKPNMGKRIGFGVMFSTLLPFALILDGVIFLVKGATSSTNFDEDEKYLTQTCWNAIGDCVEGKPIGNNNLQSEEPGWFKKLLHRQSWWSSFPMEIVKSTACFLLSPISLGASGLAFYLMVKLLLTPAVPALGVVWFGLGGLAGLCGCVGLIYYGIKKIRNAVAKRKDEQTFIKNCFDGRIENDYSDNVSRINDSLFLYSTKSIKINKVLNNDLYEKYQIAKKIINENKNLKPQTKKKIFKIIYRSPSNSDIDKKINSLLKSGDTKGRK